MTDLDRNKLVRERLGKLIYGNTGCPCCMVNPKIGAVARLLVMSATNLGRFLADEQQFRNHTLIKLELYLDRIDKCQ